MSTTPVREALLDLGRSGLLTPLRNRDFRVEATSLHDMENLFDMRVLLERHALVQLAQRRLRDPEPLVLLVDAVRDAVTAKDVRGYIELQLPSALGLRQPLRAPLRRQNHHLRAGRPTGRSRHGPVLFLGARRRHRVDRR